ncbi:MAG: DnaD domain protein [Lachnospiraceae bacterium]|nr:DnaD domain protein [Lachnospiraceae bacterium]
MATITLHDEQPITATCVPNIFIDEYMTQANGEYVKIYLYLLRSINRSDRSFSLSDIADHFDCTERDILRALKYWEKRHLFRLEYDEDGSLSAICFVTDAGHEDPIVSEKSTADAGPVKAADRFVAAAPGHTSPSESSLEEFCGKEDVRELVFITEQYLGRTLNQSDLSTIFFWYDELHFPTELIEYLIENCVASGHTSLRYMQRIAEDYAARDIHTVDEARVFTNQTSAVYYAVMKAFGIRGRNLVPSETNYLTTWTGKFGFSAEMISEACTRTIDAIHEQSFGYANSILEKWYKQGIHTLEEVKEADASFQQARQNQRAAAGGSGNRFLNFTQRDNDYEEIQNRLIQKSFTSDNETSCP